MSREDDRPEAGKPDGRGPAGQQAGERKSTGRKPGERKPGGRKPGGRKRFGSVRARATLAATAVVAVTLVAAGIAVLLSLRANLAGQADAQADTAARRVAAQIAAGTPLGRLDLPDGEEHPVQVVDEDGRVLAVSEGLESISGTGVAGVRPESTGQRGGVAPDDAGDDDGSDDGTGRDGGDDDAGGDAADDDPRAGEIGEAAWHGSGRATVDGDSAAYRFSRVEATDPRDTTVLVYAGAPAGVQREAVLSAGTAMLAGLPVLLAVVAGATWLVTRRALRPVEDIRREMAAITASEDLGRRVPEPDTGDEVARLARTTNETLTALESSVARQRGFVADASHELRSPIASLRTQLEVAVAHPELLDLPGAVEDTVRLQQLAADLLLLARLDAGERPAGTVVDLGELLRAEAASAAGAGSGADAEAGAGAGDSLGGGAVRIRIEPAAGARAGADGVDEAEATRVTGSRSLLSRVIGNLLDNARRHADGSVTATVRPGPGGRVVLTVDDDGAGVPEADRERVFERFVRLDEARSRDEGGAGLGLAIARDVARRHGGDLTVSTAPTGGARFTLTLPAAD